jgi:hypothetical protein
MAAIRSSSRENFRVATHIHDVSTGIRRRVARTTTPVNPMAPAVAQNSSGSLAGETVSTPVGVTSVISTTCRAKLPSRWWFFPCTSAAMAPPTET